MQRTVSPCGEIFPGVHDPGIKRFFDGTHRLMSPEETLARVEPLRSAMGITRIANVTGLDTIGLPVVMVTRPQARSLAVSQGKGLSLPAAKASGLMESIELYHAEHVSGPFLLESYNTLRCQCDVVAVERLMPHEAGRFHPDLPILWIEGFDLISQKPVFVPHEAVHTDFTIRMLSQGGCFHNSSSGLASGNHLLEAIGHGICEVIERDAHWQWVAAGAEQESGTRIDPDSIGDANCQALLALCHQADMRLGLWDMTASHGIPAIHCVIAGPAQTESRWLFANSGSGCHGVREVALQRAVTEAVQSRLTMISGSRDDLPHSFYSQASSPDSIRYYLKLLERPGFGRCFDELPSRHFASFHEDVRWYLTQLKASGLGSVIVVNLTRPKFDIPVVRVVIPDTRQLKD